MSSGGSSRDESITLSSYLIKPMKIPKIFLSSRFDTDRLIETAWLKRTGCRYRCFTFANVCEGQLYFNTRLTEALKVCESNPKVELMMDSGAHSLHRITQQSARRSEASTKKQAVDIVALREKMYQDYVAYCKANAKKWDFYITLDWAMHQPSIMEMQKRFESDGLRPIPVYHGDDDTDWIRKYVDMGYKLICLGIKKSARGTGRRGKKYYYGHLFDLAEKLGIKYHGLAVTDMQLLTSFPWYSVDSSTWTRNACFGALLFPNPRRNKIESIHVSRTFSPGQDSYNNFPKKQREYIDEVLKHHGFDIHEMRDENLGSDARHDWNGYIYSNLDKLGVDFDKQNRLHVKWERLLV